MLLVVFGAGASFDSVPHLPAPGPPSEGLANWEDRPPLANQLFDTRRIFVNLMEKFKDCQALVPILRHSGTSVEKKLAEFQEQAKTFPQTNRELAAIHFYLHFALWDCQDRWRDKHRGITNFSTLLREIERWRFERKEKVCFVTFNYDTMLEEAMSQVLRLEVSDIGGYRWENYSLFKLHGSINWGRVVYVIDPDPNKNLDRLYQRLIDDALPGAQVITNTYRLCDHDIRPIPIKLGARYAPEDTTSVVLYPALSIPVEKKDALSCPREHVAALAAMLPNVTKMITIGWRATEAEFLNMLLASRSVLVSGLRQPVNLLVVTGSAEGAAETVQNLVRVTGASPALFQERFPVTTGFTGLIINDLERLGAFLRT